MEKRLQLDVPSLSDPVTRDLFQESDLFVRSFSGMTSLGLLSPFDFVSMLTLTSEIISHLYVIYTLTSDFAHVWILLLSLASAFLPFILPWFHTGRSHADSLYTPQEAQAAERQEKMRHLAHNDSHRPELLLFGFGPWILESWAQARKSLLGLEKPNIFRETAFLGQVSLNEIMIAVQHVRNIGIHSSFAKVPVLILTAFHFFPHADTTSDHDAVIVRDPWFLYVVQDLYSVLGLLHQKFDQHGQVGLPGHISDGSLLLCYGFRAKVGAKEGNPCLIPANEEGNEDRGEVRINFRYSKVGRSTLIQTLVNHRSISFTYPGGSEPTLKGISFKLEAGESLAIVGCNGSGKQSRPQQFKNLAPEADGLVPLCCDLLAFTSCLLSCGTPLDKSV